MYPNNPQQPQPPYGQQPQGYQPPQQEPYRGFYAPQQPQFGQQQGWEQQPRRGRPPGPPRGRRQRSGNHRIRNVILGLLGAITLIVIIANVASGGGKSPSSASTQPPAAAANAPKSAPPSAAPSAPASTSAAAASINFSFSGSGIENSAPFKVGGGPLTVSYTYDCSSFGSSGNFIADLLYGNQASLNSDDQPIANELGTGGRQTTTVYPQYPGKDYYLSVNSECSWSITVTGG